MSGGTGLGDVFTTTDGTWDASPAPTFTYQWLRGGSPISGETANSYTIVLADDNAFISCDVTATNGSGSASEGSNSIQADDFTAPLNITPPEITGSAGTTGPAYNGNTLNTTNGTWSGSPAPTFTYQWQSDSVDISGATSNSYVVDEATEGTTITCDVTATNALGNATETSNSIHNFVPTDASNLVLYLDAKDTTTFTFSTGTNISQWDDKSGNNNHATQSTASDQANYTSGTETVDFNGDYFDINGSTGVTLKETYFIVRDYDDNDSGEALGIAPVFGDTGASAPNYTFLSTKGLPYTVSLDGAGSSTGDASVNGVAYVPGDGTGTNISVTGFVPFPNQAAKTMVSTIQTATYTVGYFGRFDASAGAAVRKLIGKHSNMIIFSAALSSTNRDKMFGYMAWKWGLEGDLPGGHPYKTTVPSP